MAAVAEHLEVSPTLEEVKALQGDHNLVPITHSFIEDCETPVSAFLKLRGDGPAFLLESAEQGQQVGRYSFIGWRPRRVIRWNLADGGDPYTLAHEAVSEVRQAEIAGLPPFAGGAVGFFGFDCVRAVERLPEPNPDVLGLPDMALMLSDVIVAFDHLRHTVTILANAYLDDEGGVDAAHARAVEAIRQVRTRLAGPLPALETHAPRPEPEFESNMTREAFEANVARIIEYIHAGDAYQVVPSQRWSAPTPVEPFSIYRGLRAVNPSPYMYFLDFEDFQIVGASPEPLLTVNGRHVSTRPIAGTRPARRGRRRDRRRTAGRREGARRARDARGPRPQRPRPRVRARQRPRRAPDGGRDLLARGPHRLPGRGHVAAGGRRDRRAAQRAAGGHALRARPKIRAMEIIDELEPVKRGAYGGAVGWLSYAGELDTCICIRTVVVKDGTAHIQAGGGTVADAKPDYEYEESRAKARGVVRAIELAVKQAAWPMRGA